MPLNPSPRDRPDPIDANPENLKDAAILGGMYVANKLIEQPAPEITVNSLKDDNPNPSPSPTSPKPMRQALGVPADEVDPVSEDGVFDQRSVPSSPVPGASAGVRVAMETATKYTESGAAVGEGDKGIASKPSDGNQVSQADRTVPLTKGRGSPNKDFTDPASNDSLLDGHAHYPDRKLSGSRLLTTEPVPRSTDIRPSAFRVDFVLQESGIEEVSTSAITALKAHSEYWTSLDTAFVVLSQMIKKR
ncbi:hypothetical protein SARC_13220 [Sphaeroforma arctica JP610]|uniref:DDHD domain-containing protein n=1 Tax=Sphaeroforma arctica JP610 TaxID=667725 RepID=A0A0L0FCP4_9EUKA|nr:hypothetical protein SARC_13220 [Sphaeroforma arctica JP610]KNC74226.1 hypothetical protein SARC_13220 [Sphaeroforma arctica JP610]|eukprot:XP_014148128.1 hypothetical protein SARC_13220 [Sphaeroforma arctica JP610]